MVYKVVEDGENEGLSIVMNGQSIEDNLPTDKNGYIVFPYVRQMLTGIECKAEGMHRKDICRGKSSESTSFTLKCDTSEGNGDEDGGNGDDLRQLASTSSELPSLRGRKKFPNSKALKSGELGTSRPNLSDSEENELTELSSSTELDADIESEDTNIAISDDESFTRKSPAISPMRTSSNELNIVANVEQGTTDVQQHTSLPSSMHIQDASVTGPTIAGDVDTFQNEPPFSKPASFPAALEGPTSHEYFRPNFVSALPKGDHVDPSAIDVHSEKTIISNSYLTQKNEEEEKIRREKQLQEERERVLEAKQALARKDKLLLDLENKFSIIRRKRVISLYLSAWVKAKKGMDDLVHQISRGDLLNHLRRIIIHWREKWHSVLSRRRKFMSEIKSITVQSGQSSSGELFNEMLNSFSQSGPDAIESLTLTQVAKLLEFSNTQYKVSFAVLPILLESRENFLSSHRGLQLGSFRLKQMWKCGLFSRAAVPGFWTPGDSLPLTIARCFLCNGSPGCSSDILGVWEGTFASLTGGSLNVDIPAAFSFSDLCKNSSTEAVLGINAAIVLVELNDENSIAFDSLHSYIHHYMKNNICGRIILVIIIEISDTNSTTYCDFQNIDLYRSHNPQISEVMNYLTSKLNRSLELFGAFTCTYNKVNPCVLKYAIEEFSKGFTEVLTMAAASSAQVHLIRKVCLIDALETELNDCIWNRDIVSFDEIFGFMDTVKHINWIIQQHYITRIRSMMNYCRNTNTTVAKEFCDAQRGSLYVVGALYRDDTGGNSTALPSEWYDEFSLQSVMLELRDFQLPSVELERGEKADSFYYRFMSLFQSLTDRHKNLICNLLLNNLWQRALALFVASKCRESLWSNHTFYILDDIHLNLQPTDYESAMISEPLSSMKRLHDAETEIVPSSKRVKCAVLAKRLQDVVKIAPIEVIIKIPRKSSSIGTELRSEIAEENQKIRELEQYLLSLRDG